MKGNSKLYGNQNKNGRWVVNNYDFKNHINPHHLPDKSIPNSSIIQKDDKDKIVRIRYYDDKGNAWKDIDYTDHGTPEKHKVPHTHILTIIDNHIDRRRK